MLEDSVLERGELALHELESPNLFRPSPANATFNPDAEATSRASLHRKVRARGLHRG